MRLAARIVSSLSIPLLGLTACTASSDSLANTRPESAASVPAAQKRPNVLFIQIDDLRPDLGIYGHPTAQTPNMDALGKSGIVFENAFVSQAVCGPSRAALMTGLRPDTTGITDLKTPIDEALPGVVTMLDMFKGAGYQTLGYGKIYHHADDDADGWTKRVEDWEHIQRRADRKAGKKRTAYGRADDRSELPDTKNVGEAIKDLRTLGKSGEPFFMAVGIHRPHLPFVAPSSDWDRYTPDMIPPRVNAEGQKGAPDWALVSYEIWNYPETKRYQPDTPFSSPKLPQEKIDELRWAYLAAVSYADTLVGDLMQELEAQGLDDNTIVVLWGDHGWKLGDHDRWAKHSNADLDIRIPLIMRVPGQADKGSRTAALVETVDIFPTLAGLAGLKGPDNLEGLSLEPLFADPKRVWKDAAFTQFERAVKGEGRSVGYTVRTARFRYTAWVAKDDGRILAQELYDLQSDPNESVNVAGDSRYSSAVKMLEEVRRRGPDAVREKIG